MTSDAVVLACELRELIAALDRRVPRVERAGEASIARDGAALRAKALRRLEELSADDAEPLPSAQDGASHDPGRE
jgi:hypothetical protein